RTTRSVSGSCKALVKRDSKALRRPTLAPLKAGLSFSISWPQPSSYPLPPWLADVIIEVFGVLSKEEKSNWLSFRKKKASRQEQTDYCPSSGDCRHLTGGLH
ncbi:unnamed protein product, partial [Tetraodon nigroviridis]